MRRAAHGTLRHDFGSEGFKLYVEVDPEIGRLYRSLIPKYLHPQPTRYAPHITVVRREGPFASWRWQHLEGLTVTFFYDPEVQYDETYFWLNCWSQGLLNIRFELGLQDHTPYTRPPTGEECFHCTVANAKRKHA
jgi:hypothetical protein